jgi:hypothetical protein
LPGAFFLRPDFFEAQMSGQKIQKIMTEACYQGPRQQRAATDIDRLAQKHGLARE